LGTLDDEGLVDIHAQLLPAHVLHLLEDEDRTGDEDDRDGELADDKAFAEDWPRVEFLKRPLSTVMG
jgi:hypothetical protein